MSRTIGSAGLALIKKFEGCRLTAYRDAVGVWTIGYGHTSGVKSGQTITQSQADAYLKSDCQKFANYVDNKAYVPISLNDNQRDALISFAFNLGQGNLKKCCAGRTASQIATAMPKYCNAGGKKLQGLVNRRAAEVALFNTPCSASTSYGNEEFPYWGILNHDTNLRATANSSSKTNVMLCANKGEGVTVGSVSNGWARVDYAGHVGYMIVKNIEKA